MTFLIKERINTELIIYRIAPLYKELELEM